MHRSEHQQAPLRHALGLAALMALAACGGGGGADSAPTASAQAMTSVSGVVADGPLKGATVCYDLNDNGSCDADEPVSTPTDDDGRYRLDVPASLLGKHAVVAQVPASAVDKDKPGVAVGATFTLRAPVQADGQVFVSPLTTLVADAVKSRGLTVAQASDEVQQQLGLAASPLANFVAAGDNHAAVLARTVNSVIVEVSRMAGAAGVSAADTRTLVSATIAADLPVLAARVQKALDTAAGSDLDKRLAAATAVSAAVLSDRNISPATVVSHAGVAKKILATGSEGATPSGWNDSSVRRFRYTDANNYSYTMTGGDTGVRNSNGQIDYDEVRAEVANGVVRPFNRNDVWWTGSDWKLCAREYKVGQFTPQTDTEPQRGRHCDASVFEGRIVYKDIAGQRMADVVAEFRAFPLRDSDGSLPTAWGPEPALLGDAVFPAGSQTSTRQTHGDIGNSEVYNLASRPRVLPDWRYPAALDELKRMTGHFGGPAPSNLNALYLDEYSVSQPDTTLRPVKRFLVGFDPQSDAVRFYKCDVLAGSDTTRGCEAAGDGRATVSAQGDARTLRFTGYPVELLGQRSAQRIFVERNGLVFRGFTWLQNSHHNQRLNGPAWDALRNKLGIPAPVQPRAADALAAFNEVRAFYFNDAANYGYRSDSRANAMVANTANSYLDSRVRVSAGSLVAWAGGSTEVWSGNAWQTCAGDLSGSFSFNPSTGDTQRCQSSLRRKSIPVTLDGRSMADVMREIRWHPDMSGWGADPALWAGALAGAFPAGAEMHYVSQTTLAMPLQLNANSLVRVPPSFTDTDSANWAVANTLDTAVVAYLGELFRMPLSANTTLLLAQSFSTTTNTSGYQDEVQYRVSFDPVGNRAKFWRTQVQNNTGLPPPHALGSFEPLLDTTFSIDVVGGRRVLSFASVPEAVLALSGGAAPMLIERQGQVLVGQLAATPNATVNFVRLNATAWNALRTALGITTP